MRILNVSIVLLIICGISSLAAEDEKYTTKYDYIDVDEIMGNKRIRDNYINCLMDRGKCTAPGAEIKSKIERDF